MMIALTDQQQAKLIHRAEHQSRRLAKRYLRDHGGAGTAAELDEHLAAAAANPAAAKIATGLFVRYEAKRFEARWEAERDAARREAHLIKLAAAGRWEPVIAALIDMSDYSEWCWWAGSQRRADAIKAWSGQVSHEQVAAWIVDHEETINWSGSLSDIYEDIRRAVQGACFDACEAEALARLEAEAVEGGRFVVQEYYRKTMGVDGNCRGRAFDDLDSARHYLALLGDFSTSSYNATIVDREVDDE